MPESQVDFRGRLVCSAAPTRAVIRQVGGAGCGERPCAVRAAGAPDQEGVLHYSRPGGIEISSDHCAVAGQRAAGDCQRAAVIDGAAAAGGRVAVERAGHHGQRAALVGQRAAVGGAAAGKGAGVDGGGTQVQDRAALPGGLPVTQGGIPQGQRPAAGHLEQAEVRGTAGAFDHRALGIDDNGAGNDRHAVGPISCVVVIDRGQAVGRIRRQGNGCAGAAVGRRDRPRGASSRSRCTCHRYHYRLC